jgi:triacylglycerol lipase
MTCLVRVAWVVCCGPSVLFCLANASGCAEAAGEVSAAPPDDTQSTSTGGTEQRHATALSTTGYAQTRYPIVLAHGSGGWKKLFGVVDYFYGIPDDLRASGATVYVTSVAALETSELRGEQLLQQVEYIAAASGAGKVNLIAHSQGGLDARYVLAARPDLIASLTTVGGPHGGSQLADWFMENTTAGGFTQTVVAVLGNSYAFIVDLLAGTDNPQDAIASINQFTFDSMADFNARYPTGLPTVYCGNGPASVNGTRFYSWVGNHPLPNVLDPTDVAFGITWGLSGFDNDGLVDRCGSHFGTVIRDNYSMNHTDEVNQIFGLVSLFETSPKTLFRAHANRLKNVGL